MSLPKLQMVEIKKRGDKMKLQGIKDLNWLMYKQYCWRYGLSEGQFKNLKRFLEGR